jgi:hypothetical protein
MRRGLSVPLLGLLLPAASVAAGCKGSTQPSPPAAHALQFDGVDDYVQVPDHSTLRFGTGDFTWEIWLQRSRAGVREDVLSKKDLHADSEHDMVLYFDSDDRAYAFVRDYPSRGSTVALASRSTIGNEWTHLAMARSGGVLQVYVNGVLERTAPAPLDVTSDGPLRIGANRGNNSGAEGAPVFAFGGQVREVRIWNVARTAQEFAADRSRCLSRTAPGLVALYRFESRSGDALRDGSGNANHGVLRNGTLRRADPLPCP